ncbi:hypothetical protein E1A91_D03G083300v1 [Gossypium mustelinum]|uniref:Uncharacterized protein n=1 Tax=Gossypium mustelinum TaxID=34275 RepID=A0A5D2VKH5_GOSMU|nr:hypothetical protein E1A91_D03G083300v1 [Gossypium mustelinum]
MQGHPEELGSLVEVLKSGMVTSDSGHQYKLQSDAKCDTMGTLWRILGVNNGAQRVFGEATGFSLLLTTLHSFQGVCGNTINRTKLHAIISSHTFYDLLSESGLLCVDYEKQVIRLLLEPAQKFFSKAYCFEFITRFP